jgi:hypothetical protein
MTSEEITMPLGNLFTNANFKPNYDSKQIKQILELEVRMSEYVCPLSFYPWIRSMGNSILSNIHDNIDEFVYQHGINICDVYIYVDRLSNGSYNIALLCDH